MLWRVTVQLFSDNPFYKIIDELWYILFNLSKTSVYCKKNLLNLTVIILIQGFYTKIPTDGLSQL